MKSNHAIILITTLVAMCVFTLTGCNADPASNRYRHLDQRGHDIMIALAWPWSKETNTFEHGALLAAEQIDMNGGIFGRKIIFKKFDDYNELNEGLIVAQKIIDDPDIMAVIGHFNADVALAVAPLYRWNGLVFLTPAKVTRLTNLNQPFVYRLNANEEQIQQQIAQYINKNGYKNILIYYANTVDGSDIANQLEKFADPLDIDIIDRRAYEPGGETDKKIIEDWKNLYQFDAMILTGDPQQVANMVKLTRDIGIMTPIIIESSSFINQSIMAANNTIIIPSIYHVRDENREYSNFVSAYQKKYKVKPDLLAMLGYDSVFLLVEKIKESNSLHAENLIKKFHMGSEVDGLLAKYKFDAHGDLIDPFIAINILPMPARTVTTNRNFK